MERLAASQLHQYLAEHRLLPCRQSAYRRSHSTETAIIDVLSDAFAAADEQQVTLMGLLDLSAAVDCVDHELLLHGLRQNFGFSGAVFEWLTSFVTGRTYQVAIKWSTFASPTSSVRSATGLLFGASALRSVHGQTQPSRPASTDVAPVRRRLSDL